MNFILAKFIDDTKYEIRKVHEETNSAISFSLYVLVREYFGPGFRFGSGINQPIKDEVHNII